MVRFRCPGVHLHSILQGQHQKLNPLVLHWKTKSDALVLKAFPSNKLRLMPHFCEEVLGKRTDFVVNATLQVTHVNPALLLFHLGVIVQNLVSQP